MHDIWSTMFNQPCKIVFFKGWGSKTKGWGDNMLLYSFDHSHPRSKQAKGYLVTYFSQLSWDLARFLAKPIRLQFLCDIMVFAHASR